MLQRPHFLPDDRPRSVAQTAHCVRRSIVRLRPLRLVSVTRRRRELLWGQPFCCLFWPALEISRPPRRPGRRARALAVGSFICIARRARAVPSQAIVRWKAGLTVRPEVLAVRRNAPGAPRYGPVKLGLRHAVSAYRGGPWEQWGRAGAAQGSIIASGTLRGSRRYLDDAQCTSTNSTNSASISCT